MSAAEDFPDFPLPSPESLPTLRATEGNYEVSFAKTRAEIEELQRLRFEVFNLELQEGLAESFDTGMDQDEYDPHCHHLLIRDLRTGRAVGTYRMQTAAMARQGLGFYAATEFDFGSVDPGVIDQSVEIGRACIARDHRSLKVLYMLWRGLGTYAGWNRARYLFGCCSLTSQDAREASRVMQFLEANGHVHASVRIEPLESHRCYPKNFKAPMEGDAPVPRLMRAYLSLGARICGDPAIDRAFSTIDYLALFDLTTMDERRLAFYGWSP